MNSLQKINASLEGLEKAKKPGYPGNLATNQDWKKMLKQLKLENIRRTAPGFFNASGGYTMQIKGYNDRTANGLTRCIIDFLTFSGYYANRQQSQGQARVQNIPRYNLFSGKVETMQKLTWTKGTTKKGTPDIDAIIQGRPVKIEVKIGADTMSGDQLRQKLKIEAAGGLYYVAHDFPSFLAWFEKVFFGATHSK